MNNRATTPTLTEQESSGAAGRTHLSYEDEKQKLATDRTSADERPSYEDDLSEYDKTIADSFPASDPPSQP